MSLEVLLTHAAPALQLGDLFGNEGPLESVLDVATGAFSFVLFLVTLYAWARRGRQPTLLIVSFAFLAFFLEHAVGLLSYAPLRGELFRSAMDFLTLSLFFVALVVRPRRSTPSRKNASEIGEPQGR